MKVIRYKFNIYYNIIIKFTSEYGKIWISLFEDESSVKVEIHDTGRRIWTADQKKLFGIESYYSTKGTKGETGEG